MKRLVQLSLIAALLVFSALAIPTTNTSVAHAATVTPNTDTTHCASLGTNIETEALTTPNGFTLGYLKIYYNSANGYNCAETVSSSATYGKQKYMYVQLMVCKETSPSNTCTPISYNPPYNDYDMASYYYYAGPVGVYGAGHCINPAAQIDMDGQPVVNYSTSHAVHCA
jgi:hypothetical protein